MTPNPTPSLRPATGRTRSAKLRAWIVFAIICVVMLIVAIAESRSSYMRAVDAAISRTTSVTALVTSGLDDAFQSTEAMLRSLAWRLPVEAMNSASQSPSPNTDLAELLEAHRTLLVSADALGLFDANGRLTQTTTHDEPLGFDVSDRPYFTLLRDNPEQDVHTSTAFWSDIGGGYKVAQTLRLTDADGSFAGIIGLRLNLSTFDQWIVRDTQDRGSVVSILDFNSRLLARTGISGGEQIMNAAIGDQVSIDIIDSFLQSGESSFSFTLRSPVDGVDRVWSMRRAEDLPFIVVAGEDRESVLASWWRDVWIYGVGWVVIAGAGAMGLRSHLQAIRYQKALDQSRRRLRGANVNLKQEIFQRRQSELTLRDREMQLSTLVSSLQDAILVLDEKEREAATLAFFDPLTLLPNRRLFIDRLQQSIKETGRTGKVGAVVFIDLDNFKALNDTRGHDAGDLLLQQVAGRLSSTIRKIDTAARLGGDEFIILLHELSKDPIKAALHAEAVANKVLSVLAETYILDGYRHDCSASIGVAIFRDDAQSAKEIIKQADVAMYEAKARGRNTVRLFDDQASKPQRRLASN